MPHSGSADLTTSVGYISVPMNDGEYVWASPLGTIGTTPVVVSFSKRVSPTLTKRFTQAVTAAGLSNNSTLTLVHADNIANGSITYGISYSPVPEGSTITYTPAFPTGFSFTILPFSEYALSFPAGTSTFDNNLYRVC